MTPIQRMDQMRVQTDDGEIWDRMSELEVGHELQTLDIWKAAQMRTPLIEYWMRRYDKKCALLATRLDANGVPIESYAISGVVASVTLAPYDANDVDAAVDKITIKVHEVVTL